MMHLFLPPLSAELHPYGEYIQSSERKSKEDSQLFFHVGKKQQSPYNW